MTSSSDARVLRGEAGAALSTLVTPELRTGAWTRFGDRAVLGDPITEQVLDDLAESTRAAARAQGFASGWSEGRQKAANESRAAIAELTEEAEIAERARRVEHAHAIAALAAATRELQALAAEVADRVEQHTLAVAVELTEGLLGRELRTADEPGADVVRRALPLLPSGVPVTVRVTPAVVSDAGLQPLRDAGATIVADPDLAPGDVLVETDHQAVDLRISTALARVREVLS